MKLNASKFYTTLFIIVIFLQLYLPSFKANVFIQILALLLFFKFEKVSINKGVLKTIFPIIIIFFIGFLATVFNSYPIVALLKDIFHFLKPLLGIVIGYFFYKKINNFKLFILTIVYVGFISALIHFGIVFIFSNIESVNEIREFSRDNFLELFALFFLLYYKKFQKESLFRNKNNFYIIFIVLLFSCVLYLSRTMIVTAIIAIITIHGYSIITKKTINAILVMIGLVLSFYIYLYSINIERNKPGIEGFFYKVKIAPSELFKTHIDRENHQDLWDHWRGYEAKRAFVLLNENPSSYIFGNGYGSLINLKFRAPLSDNPNGMKFISELHNGYMYILYKTGLVGIIIYLFFLTKLYRMIYLSKTIYAFFISAIGLIFIFTTLTITGIYNSKDIIVFILGGLLFFESGTNSNAIEE